MFCIIRAAKNVITFTFLAFLRYVYLASFYSLSHSRRIGFGFILFVIFLVWFVFGVFVPWYHTLVFDLDNFFDDVGFLCLNLWPQICTWDLSGTKNRERKDGVEGVLMMLGRKDGLRARTHITENTQKWMS